VPVDRALAVVLVEAVRGQERPKRSDTLWTRLKSFRSDG
jgi:hypothetical protein